MSGRIGRDRYATCLFYLILGVLLSKENGRS